MPLKVFDNHAVTAGEVTDELRLKGAKIRLKYE